MPDHARHRRPASRIKRPTLRYAAVPIALVVVAVLGLLAVIHVIPGL